MVGYVLRFTSSSSPEDDETVVYVPVSWVEEDVETMLEVELEFKLGIELEDDVVVTVKDEDGVDEFEEEMAA